MAKPGLEWGLSALRSQQTIFTHGETETWNSGTLCSGSLVRLGGVHSYAPYPTSLDSVASSEIGDLDGT